MEPEERAILASLDSLVHSDAVRAGIEPIVERVLSKLMQDREAVMAWEPIPPVPLWRFLAPPSSVRVGSSSCGRGRPPGRNFTRTVASG
jgi:hypothetical protein